MKISGFTRFSAVNYPEEISCVIFLKGCPLHCSYCYNKYLLNKEEIKEDIIFNFLETRKGLLDAVVISGGEPLVQYKELPNFIKRIKDYNFLIGLHTTGYNSDKEEFKQIIELVDWVGLDYKAPDYKYNNICGLDFNYFYTALNIIKNNNKKIEIRTTLDNSLTEDDLLYMQDFLLKNNINDWVLQKLMISDGKFKSINFDLNKFKINLIIR